MISKELSILTGYLRRRFFYSNNESQSQMPSGMLGDGGRGTWTGRKEETVHNAQIVK